MKKDRLFCLKGGTMNRLFILEGNYVDTEPKQDRDLVPSLPGGDGDAGSSERADGVVSSGHLRIGDSQDGGGRGRKGGGRSDEGDEGNGH